MTTTRPFDTTGPFVVRVETQDYLTLEVKALLLSLESRIFRRMVRTQRKSTFQEAAGIFWMLWQWDIGK